MRKLLVPYSGKNGQPLPIGFDRKVIKILNRYIGGCHFSTAEWLRSELESYTGKNGGPIPGGPILGDPIPIGFDRKVIKIPNRYIGVCHFSTAEWLRSELESYTGKNGGPIPIELYGAIFSFLEPRCEVESAKWIRKGLLSYQSEDGALLSIGLSELIVSFLDPEEFLGGHVRKLEHCLRRIAKNKLSELLEPYIGENIQPLPIGFDHRIVEILQPRAREEVMYLNEIIYKQESLRDFGFSCEHEDRIIAGLLEEQELRRCENTNVRLLFDGLEPYTGENGQPLPKELAEAIFLAAEEYVAADGYGKNLERCLIKSVEGRLSRLLEPYTGENGQPLPSGFGHKLFKILKPYLYSKYSNYSKKFVCSEKFDELFPRVLELYTGENGQPLPDQLAELIIAGLVQDSYFLRFYLEGVEEKKKLSVLLGPYAGGNAQPLPTGFNQKIVEVLKPRICKDMWDKLLLEGLELYTGENGQPFPKELAEAILSAPLDSCNYRRGINNYGINLERCLRKVTQETLSTLLEPYTGKNGQALPSEFGYKLFKILNPYIVCLEDLDELILRALEPYTGENGQPLSEEVAKKIIEGPKERNDDTVFYLIKCRNKENRSERYTR